MAPRRTIARLTAGGLMSLLAAISNPSAQGTAPGGVTGAALWVKADAGLLLNGATQQVTQWNDQSGSGNTTTELRASTPAHTSAIAASNDILRVANGINFNPAVDFTGTLGKSLKGNAASEWDVTPLSIFAVAVGEGTPTTSPAAIWNAHLNWTTGTAGTAGIGVDFSGTAYSLDGGGCGTGSTTSSVTEPRVIRGIYTTGANTNGGSTWLNGAQEGTGTNCATFATTFFEVGGRTAGDASLDGRIFKGKIAEVAVFKSVLSAADANDVESYLAVKYGITLNQTTPKNYTGSDSSVIWDATANAIYNRNIAGIGRDDDSSLNQKQSKSVNSDAIVTIGLGAIAADNASNPNTFAADRTFLIWGRDAGVPILNTPVPGSSPSLTRLQSVWKTQATTNVGLVTVSIPASALPGTQPMLLIGDDATFDGADAILPLTLNGANYERTILLGDEEYFTFAVVPPPAPGGVATSIALWLKANAGVTPVGGAASAWADQSGNGANASQATAANRPVIQSNAVNFNPGLEFDGSADFMSVAGTGGVTATGPLSLFGAGLRQSTGTWDAFLAHPGGEHYDYIFGWGPGLAVAIGSTNAGGAAGSGSAGAGSFAINVPRLATTTRGNGGTNVFDFYGDGGVAGTSTTNLIFKTENQRIGGRVTGADIFDGVMTEIIAYGRTLGPLELQRVHSYLAIKYGITMPQTTPLDYLASDGSVTWNAATNAPYNNNIAGIGRDDQSVLVQRQSKSVNSDEIVTIGLGTIAVDNVSNPNNFIADRTFLIWGSDSGAPTLTLPVSGTGLTRLQRVWKAQETLETGAVLVRVPASVLPGGTPTLLRSVDATFDGTDTQIPLVLNGANYEAPIDLANGDFFTFGSIPGAAPGGVAAGLVAWQKANDGISTNALWEDSSSANNDAAQGTVASQPILRSGSAPEHVNFNPTFDFDGTNDHFNYSSPLGIGGTADSSSFIAFRGDAATNSVLLGDPDTTTNQFVLAWNAGPFRIDVGGGPATCNFGTTTSSPVGFSAIGSAVRGSSTIALQLNGGGTVSGACATAFTSEPRRLGARTANFTNGVISEFVEYNRALTAVETQRAQSYLAIKYGVSLDQTTALNYLASDASVIWDATANATYKHGITGIGRDDASALIQRQSKHATPASTLVIGLGTIAADNLANLNNFPADKSFLIWGQDLGSLSQLVAVPSTNLTRLGRVWKVQETGTVGTVTVRIRNTILSGLAASLVRSSDPTFATGNTVVPMSLNGSDYEGAIDFNDGDYYTFASVVALPGGVTGSQLWLRGDIGVSLTGAHASFWVDQSGAAHSASQVTAASQPLFQSSPVNFNPALDFDAADFMTGSSVMGSGTYANANLYIVSRKNTISGADFYEHNGLAGTSGLGMFQPHSDNIVYWDGGSSSAANRLTVAGANITLGQYELKTYNASTTSGQTIAGAIRQAISKNGNLLVSDNTLASYTGNNSAYSLGAYLTSPLGAEAIAEVIVFTSAITPAQQQQIHSYLALKYGITLDQTPATNYVESGGAQVWTAATNTVYNNNIAGIGRDDVSALNQKQSQSINSANSGSLVTIGLGAIAIDNASNASTFTADKNFLVWGDDLGSTFQSTTVPGTAGLRRMGRVWRVQETGTVGPVQVRVPLSALTGTGHVLIRSTDPTFDGTDSIVPLTSGPSGLDGTIDFASGDYFTFASLPPAAPGGIGGGLALWLKANAGTPVNGSNNFVNGTGWLDQSGNNRNANTIISDPQLIANAINFNPTVRFDGNDYMRFAASPFVTSFTAGEVFSVPKSNQAAATTSGHIFDFGGGYNSHYVWSNDAVYDEFGTSTRLAWNPITKAIVEDKGGTISAITGPAVNPRLYSIYSTRSQTGNWGIAYNGANVASTASHTVNFTLTGANETVGSLGVSPWNGETPEIFLYNRVLNATERQQVNSYLAVKYGITQLSPANGAQDYLSSQAAFTWNGVANAAYHTNVAGIARDDASALDQRQSASYHPGDIVTIGLGTIAVDNVSNPNAFTADQSYLIWGRNTGALSQTVAIAATNVNRMARIWRAQESGTGVGNVVVRVPVSSLSGTQPALIRSADATFTDTDTFVPMVQNGANYEATVDFTGVEFFTFGSVLSKPGGVGGEALWLRADVGMDCTADNCTATLWEDQSGNGKDAATTAGTLSRKNVGVNFNPVLGFDTAEGMRGPSLLGAATRTDGSIYIVSKKTTIGGGTDFYEYNSTAVGDGFGVFQPYVDSIVYWDAGVNDLALRRLTAPAGTIALGQFELKSYNANNVGGLIFGGAIKQSIAKNGKLITSDATMASYTGGNKPYQLGGITLSTTGAPIAAAEGVEDFAEVIVYTSPINSAQHQAIESYLAVKYGITLDQTTPRNYVDSGAAPFWTAATNTIYKTNIAGIGRDDTSGLVQRQSKSINSGEFVTIGLGTVAVDNVSNPNNFAADKTFMTWGHDNASQVWGLAISGSSLKRMPRVWKVQETGTVASVVVRIPRTILGGVSPTLFRSVDPTFDNGDTQIPMAVSTDGTALEATIDFATGDYFTFASADGPAVRQYGDGYTTDGIIKGAIPGAITPTCYPTQFWEHVPIEQKGVFTGGNLGYMHGGFTASESTILADVNNDSKLDILAIYDGGSAAANGTYVWLGNGDGTFQTAAISDLGGWNGNAAGGDGNQSTHVGDVNGDGSVDIAYFYDGLGSAATDGTWVWLGNGDGTFQHTPIQQPTMSGGAGFAFFPAGGYTAAESTDLVDVNNDGKLDIVWVYDAAGGATAGSRVWLGNGDGTWVASPVVTTGFQGGTGVSFFSGGGVTTNESTHLVDIDKDGLVDLVWLWDGGGAVATANSGVRWWKGNGNGTFQTTVNQDLGFQLGAGFGTQGGQWGAETTRIVDVNRDGNLDVLVISDGLGAPASSGTFVWLGNGNGTFNHTPALDVGAFSNTSMLGAAYIQGGYSPNESTLVGDLNGDGVPDILWTSELNGVANSGTLVWLGKDSDKDDLADIVDPDDDNDGVLDASDICDAPGSVGGGGMQLWLKADEGATVDGSSNFIHWADQTLSNRDANLITGDPQRIDAGVNFNPTVRFDGNDFMQFAKSPFVTSFTAGESFVVLKDNAYVAGTNDGFAFDLGGGPTYGSSWTWGNLAAYNDFGTTARLGWDPVTKAIVEAKPGVASVTGASVDPRYYHLIRTHSATNDWGFGIDGVTTAASATNTVNFALHQSVEFVGSTSVQRFNGDVAEIILYNRTLTASERDQVESYLGTKYGITIGHSYLASDDTTVYWDMPANAAYHNDVAGIGRDDLATLNQKQSGSINAGNIVTIGLGTIEATNQLNPSAFAADKTFMMWGHDNGIVGPLTFVPGTSPKVTRLGRVWKVQETLAVGVVTVRVPQSALPGDSPMLIRSTDATFTSVDEFLPMVSNGTDYEVTIDYANGDFFTFGALIAAPGGVAANLGLWVKANDGPSDTTDGANVATWFDRSGAAKDLTVALPAAAVQPTFKTTSLNFNPGVRLLNDLTSNQSMWNQSFLGSADGNYNIDASVFFAHTLLKTTNCSGFATFTSPADFASNNGDHPWMGQCTTNNQLAVANTYLGAPGLAYSGSSMTALANTPYVHAYTWRYNIAGSLSFHQYGAVSTVAGATPGHSGRDFYLWRDNNDNSNDGASETNEAIVYTRQLTAIEFQRVESYLSIKYGTTLKSPANGPQDYLTSAATTIWAGIANATYHNDVAGIMADSGSALDQRVSQSVNLGAQIAIAAGAFDFSGTIGAQSPTATIGDESALVWGHNNGTTVINLAVTNTPGIEARMARIWRDQITGTGVPGQLSIRIPATMVETGNPTLRTPVVLIDDETSFDNARIVPLTAVAGFYTATFPTFTAAEQYFTIAGATSSVQLSKAFAPTPLAIGGTTRLTLTLTNVSPVTQSGLAFTDTLPSGLVIAPTANETTTCAPGTVSASGSVVSLTGGEVGPSLTCTLEVDVTTAPSVTTPITCPAASVTNGAGNITGLSPNLTLASGFGACVDVVLSTDVQIVKTAPATFVAGSTVAYTLTVTNNGPSPATGVSVTDVLPAQLTFAASAGCSAVGQTVTCTVGTLTSGQVFPITLNVQVASNLPDGTVVGNTASVTSTTPDPVSANNASTVQSPPASGSADLSIVKSTLEASVTPGNTFTYRLVITNDGPSTASNVTAADSLPAQVSFVTSPSGCTVSGQDVSCGPVATLAPSASTTFDIVVRLDPSFTGVAADISNVATTTSDTPDPDAANNTSATVFAPTVNPPSADLVATKTVVEPSVTPGGLFTYRITITNNGPSTAEGVTLDDELPVEVAFVSSPDGCTNGGGGQIVTCGPELTLAPLATLTYDIVARLDPAYTGPAAGVTNTATALTNSDDPNLANNTTNAAPLPTVTAPQADMQIVKSLDDPNGVVPGEFYSYTLQVQNNGPSFAAGVTVTDTLPANVIFQSASAGCSFATGTVTCTSAVNPMAVGGTDTFLINVQLSPSYAGTGVELTNSATVSATTADPTLLNNSSPAGAPPVNAAEADLTVVKTASTLPVSAGEQFTYTLLVSNQGPSTANATITGTDTLPTGVTFVSGPGCVAVGQAVTCTVGGPGTLTPGQSQSFVITALLTPSFTGTCADIPNTATVQSSTTADPIPANNTSASACPPLAANEADVSITKAASAAPVVPGTNFTYTLTVTNNGPSDAQGVAVTDTLPAQLTFVSSPSGCTAAGQNVTCPTIALPFASPTASFDIVVRLNPSYVGTGADILNTATVATTSFDPNTPNNTSAASSPMVAAPNADVVMAKSILEPSVIPGGTFTYVVSAFNAGPSTATNIQISDPLPAGITFVSSGSGCTAAASTVTCGPIASLLPGAPATSFTFVVRLDAGYTGTGSDLPNVATATSFTPDPDGTNNTSPPVTPNVAAASADVSIAKTAVEPSVAPGQTFSYTIVVSNPTGPSVAVNSVVTDTLPANLSFVSSTAGCTAAGQVVTCPAIPSIAVGGSSSMTLVVRLDPAYTGNGSDLGNVASVASDTADPNTANNTSASAASPTVLAPSADVRIVKNVSGASVAPGETYTYTLTVTNAGPSNATTIVATDTLPSQVTFVSSPDACTAVGQSVTCPTTASLGVGASTAFTFVVQLDPSYSGTGADILNSSLVTAATADPAMANNTSPAGAPPVGPGQADLAITKDVSTAPVTPGTTFGYTLTVSNLGPSTASAVDATDTLPTGVTFVSSPDGCTNGGSGQVVTCSSIASLVPGASATLTLIVQLDPSYVGNGSDIPNTASVTSATTDPVSANNTSNSATPVIGTASANLGITKVVVEPQALPGENFTYRLVVSNAGPSTALGVQVSDTLPAQVTFVSSPSACTLTGATVTCPPIGSLAVGASATYDIVVKLDPAYTGDGSDVINMATVTAATPDPTPANNTATTDIPDVGAGNTDVSIVKGVVETTLVPGLPLTYRLTISNAGPAQATNIAVTDTLPAQVTFVSSPASCTAVGQAVTCPTIAMLASGVSATLDIVVRLNPSYTGDGSDVLNTASAFPTTNDPNLPNNTASNVPLPLVSAPSADLAITKAALDPSVVPGATFTYRITVTNAGPSTAAGFQIDDALPLPLAFVSSPSGCSAIGQNVTCSSPGPMLPSASVVLDFTVRLDAAYAGTGSDLGNIATVASVTGDPDTTNNTSAVAPPPTVLPPTADLSVAKVAVEPSVTPGETFSYNITVSNAGPSAAIDTVVTDALPVGLTFVSSASGCTAVGQDVTCPAIATIAPGGSASVTFVVRLDPAYTGDGSDLGNTATATSPTDPTDPTSPPAPPPTVNAPRADVQIVKVVSPNPVLPGQQYGYALIITNSGPSTAVTVEVTDTLPAQATFVSSPEGCTAIGQSVTCPTQLALAPGASVTFTLTVQLDPSYVGTGGDVLNSAIVSSTTADPALANNTAPAGAPPVGPGQADLAITKDVSTAPVAPGETFTYTLRVTNQGPSTASNAVVTDTLPAGLTFDASAEGCTAVGQVVTCPTVATLVPGGSATFTVTVQLDPSYVGNGNDVSNVATVSAATPDPTLPNNTSNSATPIIGTPSADVSIAKSVIGTPAPGGTFTYRLVVTNSGPSTALGVQVTDPLPAPVMFVSSPQFCNASGQTVTCPPIGSLAVGASVTFDVVARLDPSYVGTGADVLNTATVTTSTPDPDPTDNTTLPVPLPPVTAGSADVSITKAVVEPVVTPGAPFTYRLTVENAGPATAANVQVIDTLPAQVTFVASADGCTAVGQTVTCPAVPALFPGDTATFDLVVQLDPSYVGTGSDVLNTASANAATSDPTPANNTVTAVAPPSVGPATAELTVTKQSLEPSVTPGVTFTYRIVVGNTGPSTATSVVVTDTLPAPLAFVSSAFGCTAAGPLVTCPTVATLLPGATATFEFVVRLDPAYTGDGSDLGNVATATSPTDPTDPVTPPAPPPTVNPPSADVQIVKSVSGAVVAPGDTYTYTLTITNHGPSNAVNVAVSDGLPIQTTFVSSGAGCTAVGQSVSCPPIASLGVGATQTFDLVVQLDPSYVGNGSDVLNVAIALAQTADPFMANNSSRLGAAPVGGPNADLAIVKDVSTDPVTPGTPFFYRLTVANQGPSTATNVVITDPLPVGVTFVSSPDGCTAVGQDVTCPTIASLVPGASAAVVLVVQLDPSYVGNGNDIQNVATVSSSATDPVPGNNTSNPATPVIGTPDADVAITKSVVEAIVAPGGIFTYRLVVTNAGPSTALGVVVTDPLPTQVTFVSSPQGCTAAGQHVTCPPLGSLAVGASVTFDLRVLLDPAYSGNGHDVINIATSTASTRDPVPSNGTSAPVILAVTPTGVDLAVTLTAAPRDTVIGDVVTFTATVQNPGPEAATGLTVSLPLPIDVTFEGATASVGGYAATTGVWTIGHLPIGGTATLQLLARVQTRGTPTVTAATTHVDQIERNPANNTASVALSLTGWSIPYSDLVLDGTTTPPVVAAGQLLGFELAAINRGPAYVIDLFITGEVPAGTTFAGVVPSGGAVCTTPAVGATGPVRCTWPGVTYLDPGAQRTMTLSVRVDAGAAPASSLTGHFLTSSLNLEYYEPSNRRTLTAAVADGGSGADLAVTAIMRSDGQTGTALALPLGVPTPMRFTVRNTGATPASAATYAIEIPPPDLGYLQIFSAAFSQGAVGLTGISSAAWQVGPLPAGASATFDLTVAMQSMRATTITMRRVSSAPADLSSANDRATLILDGTGHPQAGERHTAIGNVDGVGPKEVLTGAGRLETPQVRIYNAAGQDTGLHFYAYSREFPGGVRLASCDVDADGVDEIITGPGIGPGPHVRVLRVEGQVVRELVGFYAFDPSFPGGVNVACADVDHDGRGDLIAAMGESGAQVKVFGVGKDLVVEKASFTAYEPGFTGGVRLAALHTTEAGGGQYQIVTVPGPGRPLEVRAWAVGGGTATLVRAWPLTGPEYQLGAYIDVADLNGDGLAEAVLATDVGMPALIGILTLDRTQFQGIFQAYPSSFLGGSRVTLGDVDNNGRMELLIAPGLGGRPIVDAYTVVGGSAQFVLRLQPIEIP